MKESRNLSVDRDRTNIIIQDSSFDSDSCTLALYLKNTGSRSITSLKSMDLIIQLKGANASVLIPNYIESSSVLSKGGWKIPSFGDLEFEPGILNPGEIVEIQTRLDIPVPGETIGRTMVVTPNGVSAERQLGSLQTPC